MSATIYVIIAVLAFVVALTLRRRRGKGQAPGNDGSATDSSPGWEPFARRHDKTTDNDNSSSDTGESGGDGGGDGGGGDGGGGD